MSVILHDYSLGIFLARSINKQNLYNKEIKKQGSARNLWEWGISTSLLLFLSLSPVVNQYQCFPVFFSYIPDVCQSCLPSFFLTPSVAVKAGSKGIQTPLVDIVNLSLGIGALLKSCRGPWLCCS